MKQVQDLWHHIEDLSLNSPSPPVSMLKYGTQSTYQVWKIYHSTLKLGEGGCFWPISWFWSVNLVVLPTILSSGVWGAIPTIFDIHSSNGLHSISGASSWLKNFLTKISKNFHVMTSFCDVIIFFRDLAKINNKRPFWPSWHAGYPEMRFWQHQYFYIHTRHLLYDSCPFRKNFGNLKCYDVIWWRHK